MGLLAADWADATTCIYSPATLADSYANARGVIVAQVTGCAGRAGRAVASNGSCPDHLYHLSVLEVLKNSIPARDFSGAYQGAGFMDCGTALNLGQTYLLFVTETGSLDPDAGGPLKAKAARTRQLQQTLQILRDYRDGKIGDLADAWSFVDNGLSCDLRHEVAGQELAFSYAYSADLTKYSWSFEYDEDGNVARIDAHRVDGLMPPGLETVLEGPQVAANALVFRARFNPLDETVRDSATVRVGDRSWNLATHVFTLRSDGRDFSQPFVTDIALGEPAREILQAMLEPRAVVVRKKLPPTAVGATPPPGSGVSIETRTTQISAAASTFLACVDGSVRRPPPDGL